MWTAGSVWIALLEGTRGRPLPSNVIQAQCRNSGRITLTLLLHPVQIGVDCRDVAGKAVVERRALADMDQVLCEIFGGEACKPA